MRKIDDGSLMVELMLGILLLFFMASAVVSFGGAGLERLKVHRCARYGAFLKATGRLTDAQVTSEMDNYARRIGKRGAEPPKVSVGRYKKTPSSRFYKLEGVRLDWRFSGLSARFLPEKPAAQDWVVMQREEEIGDEPF